MFRQPCQRLAHCGDCLPIQERHLHAATPKQSAGGCGPLSAGVWACQLAGSAGAALQDHACLPTCAHSSSSSSSSSSMQHRCTCSHGMPGRWATAGYITASAWHRAAGHWVTHLLRHPDHTCRSTAWLLTQCGLLLQGRVSHLLFSGAHPGGGLRNVSEANAMLAYALQLAPHLTRRPVGR
jgi:hypothetical protein